MVCGGIVVSCGAGILQLMFFYINGLFLYFSFNFLINEVVHPPRSCLCVCVPLELFSNGIYLLIPLML